MTKATPRLTASGEVLYGETPEDGIIAKFYGDPELAARAARAVNRDHLFEESMSLRDWFAGLALAASLPALDFEESEIPVADMARVAAMGAYHIADAMIAERLKSADKKPGSI